MLRISNGTPERSVEQAMITRDVFCEHYAEFLVDTYDVVDRLVLNGYFCLGQSCGGFRSWWRQMHGSDETLDNTHLMRMAGRFARRVRGWAEKNHIPVISCPVGERKADIAEPHRPTDPAYCGIFAILVGRAPSPVWEVRRFGNGGIDLRRKAPMPWVNHYAFHIIDSEWGHVIIKLCGHAPFTAQIILNGHEYTACQARRAHIGFTKEGNCFTEVSDAAGLAKVADTLRAPSAIGRLREVCERWIYQCVCFGLSFDEQTKSGFHYDYSVYQIEYSRNLLFQRGRVMDEIFNGVIDRTRVPLNIKSLKTIFGYKNRPFRHNGSAPRFEVAVERPEYDLTVFKVHFGRLTLKIYTKGERVLRIESIAHNTVDLRCGRRLDRYPDLVARLSAILERFMETLRGVDASCIADDTLDALPVSSQVGKTKIGGVDLNKPRMRAVIEAVIALSLVPEGFTGSELADKVKAIVAEPYSSRQASYDLKKLRGKDLVQRIGHTRRYQPGRSGLRTLAALLVLRDKVIKPVLAGAGRPRPGRPLKTRAVIDEHYHRLQTQLRALLSHLGIAA